MPKLREAPHALSRSCRLPTAKKGRYKQARTKHALLLLLLLLLLLVLLLLLLQRSSASQQPVPAQLSRSTTKTRSSFRRTRSR